MSTRAVITRELAEAMARQYPYLRFEISMDGVLEVTPREATVSTPADEPRQVALRAAAERLYYDGPSVLRGVRYENLSPDAQLAYLELATKIIGAYELNLAYAPMTDEEEAELMSELAIGLVDNAGGPPVHCCGPGPCGAHAVVYVVDHNGDPWYACQDHLGAVAAPLLREGTVAGQQQEQPL